LEKLNVLLFVAMLSKLITFVVTPLMAVMVSHVIAPIAEMPFVTIDPVQLIDEALSPPDKTKDGDDTMIAALFTNSDA
jgi:sorbitol-specific phosphotransferase system component IIBC